MSSSITFVLHYLLKKLSLCVIACVRSSESLQHLLMLFLSRFLEIALHDASQTVDEDYLTLGSYDSELSLLRSQVAQRVASFLSDPVSPFHVRGAPHAGCCVTFDLPPHLCDALGQHCKEDGHEAFEEALSLLWVPARCASSCIYSVYTFHCARLTIHTMRAIHITHNFHVYTLTLLPVQYPVCKHLHKTD